MAVRGRPVLLKESAYRVKAIYIGFVARHRTRSLIDVEDAFEVLLVGVAQDHRDHRRYR